MIVIIKFFIVFILATAVIQSQNLNYELLAQSKQLINSGRYGEAIDLLNRFVAANPQNTEGYILRGTCFASRGDFEFAVSDFRTAKRISPSDPDVNRLLNSTFESWRKLLFNQIEGYKREIAIHPDKPINYLEIGKAYKNLGEWREAEIWYDEYLKREEPSPDEVLRYTEILAQNNQLLKGEKILKRFTTLHPGDHRLWSRYGYFLYWLGRKKSAINAFEESLALRPFFKEAADGLDLAKGKGYVYTINDTTARSTYGLSTGKHVYIIDRLNAEIKKKPEDIDLRFKLIDELVKVNRFEEAVQQIEFLIQLQPESNDVKNLYLKVLESRNIYYKNRIDDLEQKLSYDPGNASAMLQLAEFYSLSGDFELSKKMYSKYLSLMKEDDEVRYNFARLLFWNEDICKANDQAKILLIRNPGKTEYQLLSANIMLRLNENLQYCKELYKKVLNSQPDSKEAVSGLLYVSLREQNADDAEKYYLELKENDSTNEKELSEFLKQIDDMKKILKQNELFSILEEARISLYHGRCISAVDGFEHYFNEGGTNQQVYFELAEAYQCKGNFKKAISIYDEMIELGFDDSEMLKQRAKRIFWSGDSVRAFREFEKLYTRYPDDAEIKLFLGDCYFKLNQYSRARELYNELLELSPGSHIVKMRLKWLGSEGIDSFAADAFPTYVMISPQGNYFSDNTDFDYSLLGTGIEFGITKFLAFGLSGYRGTLSSEVSRLNFNTLKGSIFLNFNDNLKAGVGAGQTYFVNDLKEDVVETNLTMSEKELYTLTLFYNRMDAAFILYSPFLADTRLVADFAGLHGDYNFKGGLILSGRYSFINVSDDNSGNQIQFRIGSKFKPDIKAGYEYYYYSVSEESDLYWSPALFEAHSIWADFNLIKNTQTTFSLGGKIGIIPENDFVLREFNLQLIYKFAANFNLQVAAVTGSSSRAGTGYNSTGLRLALFWSP